MFVPASKQSEEEKAQTETRRRCSFSVITATENVMIISLCINCNYVGVFSKFDDCDIVHMCRPYCHANIPLFIRSSLRRILREESVDFARER